MLTRLVVAFVIGALTGCAVFVVSFLTSADSGTAAAVGLLFAPVLGWRIELLAGAAAMLLVALLAPGPRLPRRRAAVIGVCVMCGALIAAWSAPGPPPAAGEAPVDGTPLMLAAYARDVDEVKRLLHDGVELNAVDKYARSALAFARMPRAAERNRRARILSGELRACLPDHRRFQIARLIEEAGGLWRTADGRSAYSVGAPAGPLRISRLEVEQGQDETRVAALTIHHTGSAPMHVPASPLSYLPPGGVFGQVTLSIQRPSESSFIAIPSVMLGHERGVLQAGADIRFRVALPALEPGRYRLRALLSQTVDEHGPLHELSVPLDVGVAPAATGAATGSLPDGVLCGLRALELRRRAEIAAQTVQRGQLAALLARCPAESSAERLEVLAVVTFELFGRRQIDRLAGADRQLDSADLVALEAVALELLSEGARPDGPALARDVVLHIIAQRDRHPGGVADARDRAQPLVRALGPAVLLDVVRMLTNKPMPAYGAAEVRALRALVGDSAGTEQRQASMLKRLDAIAPAR